MLHKTTTTFTTKNVEIIDIGERSIYSRIKSGASSEEALRRK